MCRRNVGVVFLAPFPGVSTELKFYVLSFSLNEAQCNGLNISRWEFLFSFTTFHEIHICTVILGKLKFIYSEKATKVFEI